MMISPECFVRRLKDNTFEELIAERDLLVFELKELEKIVFKDDRMDPRWSVRPGPNVQYQMNLEYLAALCKHIAERYNREIVHGDDEEEE